MDKLKKCCRCKKEKNIIEFHAQDRAKDNLRSACKECTNDFQKSANIKYPHRRRENAWKQAGIKNADGSPFKWKDYENLKAGAQNKCMLCGTDTPGKKDFSVDHDHLTGVARFLLCGHCNHGLGNFKDSPYLLQKAIDLLLNYQESIKK